MNKIIINKNFQTSFNKININWMNLIKVKKITKFNKIKNKIMLKKMNKILMKMKKIYKEIKIQMKNQI